MNPHPPSRPSHPIWPLIFALALIALWAVAGEAAAQQPTSLDVIVSQIDEADYPEVRLVVSVADETGRPLAS